jgi:hypothetical protein
LCEERGNLISTIHGLSQHGLCCALAGIALIEADLVGPAAALARIAIEHSLVIEWLLTVEGALERFQNNQIAEIKTLGRLRVNVGYPVENTEGLWEDDADRTQVNMSHIFDEIAEPRPDLEIIWKILSRYVHHSQASVQSYAEEQSDEGLRLLSTSVEKPEWIAWYLSLAAFRIAVSYLNNDVVASHTLVLEGWTTRLGLA